MTTRKNHSEEKAKYKKKTNTRKNDWTNNRPTLRLPRLSTPATITYFPVKELGNMWKNRTLHIEGFQRKGGIYKSKSGQKQELIQTVLNAEPLVPKLAQEKADGTISLIDGQQTMLNLLEFRKNKFKISKSINTQYTGKKFNDLSSTLQNSFDEYPIACMIVHGGNGVGRATYIRANSGIPINKSETRRAWYYDTPLHKYVQSVCRELNKQYLQMHILTENDILRCKDEEFIAENLILVSEGPKNGSELSGLYQTYKNEPSLFKELKDSNPEKNLKRSLKIVKKIFPEGLKNTKFDNLTGFYGLLGAINTLDDSIFSTAKCKRINEKLVDFATESTRLGRQGKATGQKAEYYATISRSTKDKAQREKRIKILKELITQS